MKKYERDLKAGKIRDVPQQHAELFERYFSGHFDQEIDALTEQHGFGLLRTRLEHLAPLGLTCELCHQGLAGHDSLKRHCFVDRVLPTTARISHERE